MSMHEEKSYVVFCKFDVKNPNSTAYEECSTLEDVYKSIQVFQRRNPTVSPDQIEFSKLIDSLRSIPFLKVYWYDPCDRMNYLQGAVNFSRGYKAYMSRASDEATKIYEELKLACETKEEFVKSEIENAADHINNERKHV